ncbi:hypothetical protein BDFB_012799 [Asbolus verrucosus]|uniref:Uncharacterized protein n=1 Tax=Asbolus verrucosus TaxID=1661398 RepID=A0A482W388_ASBVE|nr:hypothetical protein BDFB_012799 [Asbolus verrucosus]
MLCLTDWSFLHDINDIDIMCQKFYSTLNNIFGASVPVKKKHSNRQYPSWFDKNVIKCLRTKDKFFRLYKMHKSVYYLDSYKKYRMVAKRLIDGAYESYINNIQDDLAIDPRKFWEFVYHKKRTTRIPGIMRLNRAELSTTDSIINAFSLIK